MLLFLGNQGVHGGQNVVHEARDQLVSAGLSGGGNRNPCAVPDILSTAPLGGVRRRAAEHVVEHVDDSQCSPDYRVNHGDHIQCHADIVVVGDIIGQTEVRDNTDGVSRIGQCSVSIVYSGGTARDTLRTVHGVGKVGHTLARTKTHGGLRHGTRSLGTRDDRSQGVTGFERIVQADQV